MSTTPHASGAFVPFDQLAGSDLHTGLTYEGGSDGNFGDEPLHHLLPVGTEGGIRLAGTVEECNLVALFSTLDNEDWPDEIDAASGTVTYHGDNRSAQAALLQPTGNRLLRRIFQRGFRTPPGRRSCPPFFVFTSTTVSTLPKRSQRFEGVAVPGAVTRREEDWLVAKWFDRPQARFENYVVTLTLLDVPVVSRRWIDELIGGHVDGPSCPDIYRHWLETGQRRSLGLVG